MDNAIGFPNIYPLDSDLSGGWRYLTFEQPDPGLDLVTSSDTKISGFRNHSGLKIADSYAGFTGYVWTEAAYGKKKLRIKKYPDMCELGLKLT